MALTNEALMGPTSVRKLRKAEGVSTSREKKERVHITMGKRSKELLDLLAQKTEGSYTEVFRNALRLYAALIEETEKGGEVYVKDKEGNLTAYKIFV